MENTLTTIAGAMIEEPTEPMDENEQKIQAAVDAVKEAYAISPDACRRILEAMRIPSIFAQTIVTDQAGTERLAAEMQPKMPELPEMPEEFFGEEGEIDYSESKQMYCIGFGPVVIPPGATVTCQATPHPDVFCGRRIVNTRDNDDLFFSALLVGDKAQRCFTRQNPIAASSFDRKNEIDLGMDRCVETTISIEVVNIGDTTKTWSASMFGEATYG